MYNKYIYISNIQEYCISTMQRSMMCVCLSIYTDDAYPLIAVPYIYITVSRIRNDHHFLEFIENFGIFSGKEQDVLKGQKFLILLLKAFPGSTMKP